MHVPTRWSRLPKPSRPAVDAIVVAAVAFPTLMDAWWNEEGTRQADGWTYAFALLGVVALLGRRRWPVPVALVTGISLTGLYELGHHGELLNLPMLVALYTLAAEGPRSRTIVTALIASTWSGILGFTSDDPIGARGGSPVLEVILPLVPLALGEAMRAGRAVAAYAAEERDREARRRVEDERARMSRELHDVVAHTMAAVNVQMAAAVAAFDRDPATARKALLQARASSRSALQELRATVALARQDGSTAPTPGLDRLPELAGPARAAGIEVSIRDDRGDAPLSGAAELAAYRLVQEALTNVVRHSGARHVDVSLRSTGEGLLVEVVDDGDGTPASTPSDGFGLVGMAERVHASGGRLHHGSVPGGGFRVQALLPTTEQAT